MPTNRGAKVISFNLALFFLVLIVSFLGCNKLVHVPNPITSVTTNQVFSSDATATSAVLGIYSYMNSLSPTFSNYYATYLFGISGDELTDEPSGYEYYDDFLENHVDALKDGGLGLAGIWQPAYFVVYSANAVIEGLQASTNVSERTRSQLTGEAKFIRAFCYFYLTNAFGDVPLDLTTDFNKTALLARSPQAQIYDQIINDLIEAQNLLPSDFSMSGGMPIRANKWAATSLLARAYLFLANPNWQSADSAASAVINSGQFSLVGLDNVFLANSKEAILQLQTPNTSPYATLEAQLNVSACYNCGPGYVWMTSQLVGSFEPNDLRWADWVDSSTDGVNTYYSPYKYKVNYQNSGPAAENYTLLRLAEQFLIRAEAQANGAGGGLSAAIADLNVIRTRAGLPAYAGGANKDSVLSAIRHEKRIEFFAEWGHRWLDLKRWGIAVSTLDSIPYKAPYINSDQLLYPIPTSEIQSDPNLTQNHGYSSN